MATIEDLRQLGYTVGMAHGSVQVEQDALDAAKAAADPNTVAQQMNQATTDTVQMLDKLGRLPETPEERLELASQIATAALEGLTAAVTEKVAFHERALVIAQESPDVWIIQQLVTVDGSEQPVAQLYVACKEDGTGWDDEGQATLDALADPATFAERIFQAQNQDAVSAGGPALLSRGS